MLGAVTSLAAGLLNNRSAAKAAQKNYEMQKEFAQNGIRWRVADAKAAGLHPLAALGAAPVSSSGAFVGGDYGFLSDMGQDISRAAEAKKTAKERAYDEAKNAEADKLRLENMRLQNKLLQSQISSNFVDAASRAASSAVRSISQVPPMPDAGRAGGGVIAGQAQSYPTGSTRGVPAEVVASMASAPNQQAGHNPDVAYLRSGDGLAMVKSDAAKDATDDELISTMQWWTRNGLSSLLHNLPGSFFRSESAPTRTAEHVRKGLDWYYYPVDGVWRLEPTLKTRLSKLAYYWKKGFKPTYLPY